jgi:hypothetical protein
MIKKLVVSAELQRKGFVGCSIKPRASCPRSHDNSRRLEQEWNELQEYV